ncbi:hypothetical protein [Flavobacterium branchiicola]|uniref:Lipoprotein n=1 Tax=Flavobacterium branchiicola TaxID=1114875 RepID=A0ABV9PK24_9FLAO|nr:hypothetical protein [Flavobacterium branchiicola]MBS7256322.1 hypothetical protein [Flavobacterium branchiicola]
MKKILILLIAFVFFCCNSDDQYRELNSTHDISTEISVFNDQNEDLLNPNNFNHLDFSKIKLFYVIDGVSHDYTTQLDLVKRENEYRINMLLNDIDKSEKKVMYIQWNENDRDTIEFTIKAYKNLYKPNTIWFNNKVVWQFTCGICGAEFKIIK